MKKILSQINPAVTIAVIETQKEIDTARNDLTQEHEVLQLASCRLQKGHIVKAHYHNQQERNTKKTQESLVVLDGSMLVTFYDIDHKTEVNKTKLNRGDCAILLNGGHKVEILEDNTKFYEFKNGPYFGHEKDRTVL